jgi:hypothetical protein
VASQEGLDSIVLVILTFWKARLRFQIRLPQIHEIIGSHLTTGEVLSIALMIVKCGKTRRKEKFDFSFSPSREFLRPFSITNGMSCRREHHSADVDIEEIFGRILYLIILCLLMSSNG